MLRSSPPPEPLLGKRIRDADLPGDDDDDSEPENDPSATHLPPSTPSISNVTAVALRYASKKKLRPDQREEVQAFFSVSAWLRF